MNEDDDVDKEYTLNTYTPSLIRRVGGRGRGGAGGRGLGAETILTLHNSFHSCFQSLYNPNIHLDTLHSCKHKFAKTHKKDVSVSKGKSELKHQKMKLNPK